MLKVYNLLMNDGALRNFSYLPSRREMILDLSNEKSRLGSNRHVVGVLPNGSSVLVEPCYKDHILLFEGKFMIH